MKIFFSDLEGVFTPEIWVKVAEKTGIEELHITTRDEPDYDKLMKYRLNILDREDIKIQDIQEVIASMPLLDGAVEFMDWLREQTQLIVLSDTFEQFADPLMKKLKRPTLLCHDLTIADDGQITGYNIRMQEQKKATVEAFKKMNYETIAFGDSYNDIAMLKAASVGILFRPPQNVIDEFPEFPVCNEYSELKAELEKHL